MRAGPGRILAAPSFGRRLFFPKARDALSIGLTAARHLGSIFKPRDSSNRVILSPGEGQTSGDTSGGALFQSSS